MTSSSTDRNNSLRILGISGSLRKASFNAGLLRAAQELAPENMEITIYDLMDVPFYNGDVEDESDPPPVTALKTAIHNSDGILFATPEYNFGVSGVLKNAIDWASRDREPGSLMGKPAAIMGAGGRAGTARSQLQLQQVLAETGTLVMVKPGVLIAAFNPPQFDDQGNLVNQDTKEIVRRHLAEFSKWVMRLVRPGEYHRFACEMDIQAMSG